MDRVEMPGLGTAVMDPLEAHPELPIPELIPMNSWKKLQVPGQASLERAALASFFRGQGMTEGEVTEAITRFKVERAANQPNWHSYSTDLTIQEMKSSR